ncbi:MAG: DUF4168 domain-containing protein [Cyanobacteria bacterium J06560_6]
MGYVHSLNRMFRHSLLVITLCVVMLLGAPAVCLADTPVPAPITNSADVAAEKLDQFAQAYLQVLQLLSDRESEIPAAETNAEAIKVEKSIEAEAIAIIQDSGLSLPEYMQILGLASQDEAFQDQLLGRIDESGEEG